MARPRDRSPDAVLDDAVALFGERGYADIGMSELVERLGVPRSTLYADHGSKQGLWLAALDRYRKQAVVALTAELDDTATAPLDRLDRALAAIAASLVGPNATCLVVNATCERGGVDEATTRLVNDQLDLVTTRLRSILELAAADGSLGPTTEPADLAALLSTVIQGARVLARLDEQRDAARRGVEEARRVVADRRTT